MIEVYSWATPNGHKVHIMLEECGLAYRAIPVNIGAGEQFTPQFLAISPNNKIPAIVEMAIFPWLRSWKNQGIDWNDYPHLKGWFDEIAGRPAVQRGVTVLADLRKPLVDDKAREILFGSQQYQRH